MQNYKKCCLIRALNEYKWPKKYQIVTFEGALLSRHNAYLRF